MSAKPSIEKIDQKSESSFFLRKVVRERRPDHSTDGVWHYHKEYEILLTTESSGRRIVGYSIDDYAATELVLLGENLPHCWLTDHHVEQYVIQFTKESIGDSFWSNSELALINKLLSRSQQGIKFDAGTTDLIAPKILGLFEVDGFERLLLLFQILDMLSKAENTELLTFKDSSIRNSLKASNRMEKIYSYIHENYDNNQISLTNLSDTMHMTPSSLCKFINKVTRKTFTELLIETRIKEACKLLLNSDKHISEIAFLCGFHNLSGFNRNFKKMMHKTPREYRKIYTPS